MLHDLVHYWLHQTASFKGLNSKSSQWSRDLSPIVTPPLPNLRQLKAVLHLDDGLNVWFRTRGWSENLGNYWKIVNIIKRNKCFTFFLSCWFSHLKWHYLINIWPDGKQDNIVRGQFGKMWYRTCYSFTRIVWLCFHFVKSKQCLLYIKNIINIWTYRGYLNKKILRRSIYPLISYLIL